MCDQYFQKINQHNTHINPISLPKRVKIIRDHHPLEGHSLKVAGHLHRNGQLTLILNLPDDTRTYIPVTWTDLSADKDHSVPPISLLLAIPDFLLLRKKVDYLLTRFQTKNHVKSKKRREKHFGVTAIGINRNIGSGSSREKDMEGNRSRIKNKNNRNGNEINKQINTSK